MRFEKTNLSEVSLLEKDKSKFNYEQNGKEYININNNLDIKRLSNISNLIYIITGK